MNNEEAQRRFLDDGKIEINNNAAENSIRPIAPGRKSYLFSGSGKGGETADNIHTITETCKINDINPQKYLTKVFDVIQGCEIKDMAELLPWNIELD